MQNMLPPLDARPVGDGPVPPREQREAEILDRIRDTFAEKGFDGASMQELARAAGMSVGNFYRYFPSKAAMVQSIVRRDLAEVEQKFAMVLEAQDPYAALRYGLHAHIEEECAGCSHGTLWAEINAAAARKPEISAVVCEMEDEISRYFTMAFERITRLDRAEVEGRFSAHARMAVLLVKTVAMQGNRENCVTPTELVGLVKRIIDVILDEVVTARVEG